MGISVIGGSTGGAAKIEKTDIITSTDFWVCPADVTRVNIEICGGGGGGSRGTIVQGGGAGSYFFASLSVIPGAPYMVTIGAGGAGATSSANGSQGSPSYFGGIFEAAPGQGGRTFNNGVALPGGRGAKPHSIAATAQNADVEVGGHGMVLGGAGGTGAANGYAVNASIGSGGGGNGGWDTALNATNALANSGAGGGGGGNGTNGGNGGSGICIIKYWSAL